MENYEESKPKTFKFGAVGDFLKGTLIKVDKTTQPDQYGKKSYIYTVKAKEGLFHDSIKNEKTGKTSVAEKETVLKEGDEYTIFISEDKGVVIGKMKDGKVGNKFMIKFDELKPTTKGNDAKIIKVFWAKDKDGKNVVDADWLAENPEGLEKF